MRPDAQAQASPYFDGNVVLSDVAIIEGVITKVNRYTIPAHADINVSPGDAPTAS
jgi:hypothetical protein